MPTPRWISTVALMAENIHAGHRQRVRDEYKQLGLENFSTVRALEMLLFYVYPYVDTNPIAHRLLDEFGSLKGVLNASLEDLERFGMSESQAILLKIVPEISRKAQIESLRRISSTTDASVLAKELFRNCAEERFVLFCLNNKNELLGTDLLASGVVNSVKIEIRKIAEYALRKGAVSVIIAHNHPGGIASPSDADLHLTNRIKSALSQIDITLLDHLIVSDDDVYSFSSNGL